MYHTLNATDLISIELMACLSVEYKMKTVAVTVSVELNVVSLSIHMESDRALSRRQESRAL